MKSYLLLFAFVFSLNSLWAQVTSVPFSLEIGTGVDLIANRDISASPLEYSGFGLPLGLNFFESTGKFTQQFELRMILPQLTNNYRLSTPFQTELTSWYKVNLQYQLLYRLGNDHKHAVGGSFQSNFFLKNYDFLDGVSWDLATSLNLDYSYTLALNEKSFLMSQISLPLVGFVNRKPALTLDEVFLNDFYDEGGMSLLKYGKWKTLSSDWWQVQLDILYHWQINKRFNLQAKLGLNYYQIQFPEKVNHLNFPIRCYLNYQF
ncbi:MAG: hypothetical protein AB8G15_12185 [Saprospiraceae bacterium]